MTVTTHHSEIYHTATVLHRPFNYPHHECRIVQHVISRIETLTTDPERTVLLTPGHLSVDCQIIPRLSLRKKQQVKQTKPVVQIITPKLKTERIGLNMLFVLSLSERKTKERFAREEFC